MKRITLLFVALILLSCSESEDVTPLIEDLQRDVKAIQFALEALSSRISRSDDITLVIADIQEAIEDLQRESEGIPPLISDLQETVENLEGEVDFLIEDSDTKFNALTGLIESTVRVECDLYSDWQGSWKHVPSIFNDAESGFRFHDNGECELIGNDNGGWTSLLEGRYWVCSESYILIFFSDEGPSVFFGTYTLNGDALTLLWFDGDLVHELKKI